MVKEKDNLMNKTHNETIQNNNNPHVIHQNYLQISNFPFKNKNINNIIHQEDEQKAILQNSCANGILNFHENHNNSYDRSLCEIYKPMISPINLVNNIQGGLIFPFQSNTKNSFNLNIENYIMKPNEDESIFHYHNAHNMLTNIHHNENGNKSNFMNNYSHIFNGFSSNFQPCYGSQYHSCISPSVNCRLYEINNNTNAKEINIQKNKILINEITDNLNDEIIINTPNNNSINTGIDFGNVISINKNNDDDVTNNIRTLKENTITNNSLKNKKNSLPKLDFNTINPSETFKIFNDSLSIPCNSYNNDFDFYKFPLSNKSKIQSLFSPVEIKNDNNSYESNSFVEIKAKNNEKLIGNINVKERTLLKFNISPKSAFLLTKKN